MTGILLSFLYFQRESNSDVCFALINSRFYQLTRLYCLCVVRGRENLQLTNHHFASASQTKQTKKERLCRGPHNAAKERNAILPLAVHRKSTQKERTERAHRKNTPKEHTERAHQKSTSKEHTERSHQKSTSKETTTTQTRKKERIVISTKKWMSFWEPHFPHTPLPPLPLKKGMRSGHNLFSIHWANSYHWANYKRLVQRNSLRQLEKCLTRPQIFSPRNWSAWHTWMLWMMWKKWWKYRSTAHPDCNQYQ